MDNISSDKQFQKARVTGNRNPVIQNEEKMNKKLRSLLKNGEIDENLYNQLRSTGAQPARLYGLAKVHKENTPLRPVLSLPGSQYDKINKWLAKLFEKVPGANIETSTRQFSEKIRKLRLPDDETVFSMDVKSLYTNVPVREAIDLACDALYSSEEVPRVSRATVKTLMDIAVTEVWFMSGTDWYIQKDGVAMGASMAVVLANLWLKKFEENIALEASDTHDTPTTVVVQNAPYPCGKCGKNVSRRGYSFACIDCLKWFHRICTSVTIEEARAMNASTRWQCGCRNVVGESAKIFDRYVDDIFRSGKTDSIESILERANNLHPNLEFTIERLENGKIPFLDMTVGLNEGNLTTAWYQKPTDTGLMLSFRAWAPTVYKKNIIEGTIHRIFNATSNWALFHEALTKAMRCWEDNQYPPQFYESIIRRTMEKLVNKQATDQMLNQPPPPKKNRGTLEKC